MKTLKGQKMPSDFWNYACNPITGFSTKESARPKEEKKYYMTRKTLPNN